MRLFTKRKPHPMSKLIRWSTLAFIFYVWIVFILVLGHVAKGYLL